MKIEYLAILTTAMALWAKAIAVYGEIRKIAEPIIKEVEIRAKDGLIDKADRKAIVMAAILRLQTDGTIKLSWVARFVISRVVDYIASRLPDFKISQGIVELVLEAKKDVATTKMLAGVS